MTDTTAPALTWGEAFRGLLPSLNTSLVAIVTAGVTLGGTLVTQRMLAKPVEAVKPVTVERIIERQVDLGPLTMKVEEALAELRAAKSAAGVNRRKKTDALK